MNHYTTPQWPNSQLSFLLIRIHRFSCNVQGTWEEEQPEKGKYKPFLARREHIVLALFSATLSVVIFFSFTSCYPLRNDSINFRSSALTNREKFFDLDHLRETFD